jgi:hypothetical protein
MKVYYRNALQTATALAAATLKPGEAAADLIQQDLERTVSFQTTSAIIVAQWTPQTARVADTLFVSNTNATQYSVQLFDQNMGSVITKTGLLGRWNNKIELPTRAIGMTQIELSGTAPLYVGMLFLSLGLTLPRFTVGVDMSDSLRGTGAKSYGGQTYGRQGVTLETLSLAWQRVTNEERRVFREYLDSVQLHQNHYISPYEGIDQYVTVTGAGTWTKHDGDGFYWDTSIKYEEAR